MVPNPKLTKLYYCDVLFIATVYYCCIICDIYTFIFLKMCILTVSLFILVNNRRRERQLDTLRKMEEKLKGAGRKVKSNSDNQPSHPKMAIFVLDVGCVIGRCTNHCQEDCSKRSVY